MACVVYTHTSLLKVYVYACYLCSHAGLQYCEYITTEVESASTETEQKSEVCLFNYLRKYMQHGSLTPASISISKTIYVCMYHTFLVHAATMFTVQYRVFMIFLSYRQSKSFEPIRMFPLIMIS